LLHNRLYNLDVAFGGCLVEMWITAHRYQFMHFKRNGDGVALCKHGAELGQLIQLVCINRLATDMNFAPAGPKLPAKQFKQCAFAGSVRPDNCQQLTRLYVKTNAVDEFFSAN